MYKVVIVDDEATIVDGLKSAISWDGYNFQIVLATTSPLKALEYIQEHEVQLLITDVSMPELDGLELIKKCKASYSLLSVLVLSAYDDFAYVRTALRYGAENYLLKPLDPDELAESISQIANNIQQREELSLSHSLNLLTFRSTFTENWVKNTLNRTDLKRRAAFLGINLNLTNFTVLIFTSSDKGAKTMSLFFEILLSSLLGKGVGNFYFENPKKAVCVLSEIKTDEPLESFICHLLDMARYQGLSIFCSCGPRVDTASLVHKSYAHAASLLFMQYTKKESIFAKEPELNPLLLSKICRSYKNLNLEDYMDGLSSHLTPHTPQTILYSSLLEIMKWSFQELNDQNINTLEDYPELMDCMQSFPDSEDGYILITDFIRQVLKIIFDLLSSPVETTYPIVDAVIESINSFSDKNISLKTLALKMNVSASYLGNLFHQQTGYYFNDYLTQARLKYATDLLINTDMIIKDIVDQVGFSSQTYFNRIFKRHFDLSPLAYRRMKHTS